MYECTFIGRPEPTTGSYTLKVRQGGTYSNSDSYTIEAEALVFNDLTLPTTIPKPLKDEYDSGAGGGNGGDDEEATGSGDRDSEDDKKGAAGKVEMAWLGLVPELMLGLVV